MQLHALAGNTDNCFADMSWCLRDQSLFPADHRSHPKLWHPITGVNLAWFPSTPLAVGLAYLESSYEASVDWIRTVFVQWSRKLVFVAPWATYRLI